MPQLGKWEQHSFFKMIQVVTDKDIATITVYLHESMDKTKGLYEANYTLFHQLLNVEEGWPRYYMNDIDGMADVEKWLEKKGYAPKIAEGMA